MVAITAVNSATPTVQVALGRAKLQQARREAEQAESTAQNLRQQADAAELEAQSSQAKVSALALAGQNEKDSGATYSALRSKSSTEVPVRTQDFLVSLYHATSQKRAEHGNTLKSDANAALVKNSQGQATGRIVNVTA